VTELAMPKTNARRHGDALKLHRRYAFGEVSSASLGAKFQQDQPQRDVAVAVPLKYLIQGGAADSPRRGGARNHKSRESLALKPHQVANLRSAAVHAGNIGLPLNRMITIHWESAGVALPAMASATGRFTDLLSKALARHGSHTAWVWTHENGVSKGAHCHLIAHVSPSLVGIVTGLQKGWLRRITGKPYKARVIFSRPIGAKLGVETLNPEVHAQNLHTALSYILKGVHDAHDSGSRIIGKRCATSQNIGASARTLRKASYVS
jgi:hypothetical protein